VNLFQDFITQKEADPTSIIIAAVSQGQVLQDVVGGKPKGTGKLHGQKRGKPGGKAGNTNTADRYYTSAEWGKLSSSERRAIIAICERRGDGHKKAKHDKDKQENAAIVTQTIASLKTTKGSIFTEASSETEKMTPGYLQYCYFLIW